MVPIFSRSFSNTNPKTQIVDQFQHLSSISMNGELGGEGVVVVPHRQHEGLFMVNNQLCTKSLIPGEEAEKLYSKQNEDGSVVEYRVWDPSLSKLASVILVGLNYFAVKPGVKVLYLVGAADCFATVSHLSDIVGTSGMVYAVTTSSPPRKEELSKRTNVRLINEDPSNPSKYRQLLVGNNVDVMLSEIPLDSQIQTMALNASYFLKVGGHFLVSFQAKPLKFRMHTSREVIRLQFMRLFGTRLEPHQGVHIDKHVAYYVGSYKGPDSHTMAQRK